LLVLVLGACGGDATPTPIAVVVESGVTPLTTSTLRTDDNAEPEKVTDVEANPETDAGDAEFGDGAPAPTSDGIPTIEVGAEVQARGIVRIYGAATPTSPTLATYTAGARFIVMGPPGDVTAYPVELAGVRWYRVRATDELAGWVIADGIEPVTDEAP